ncbi:MAG: CHAD domain-containing protein [Isosphaeraceae bacterium]
MPLAVVAHPAGTPSERRVNPGDPAALLIRKAFEDALSRLRAADPEARKGDVEGVHRLRTSTRRLRSELRTVRSLVDPEWRQGLESELKWLAAMLGSVRDLDILARRLREAEEAREASGNDEPSELDDASSPLGPIFDELRARHHRNSESLREALRSGRYRALIARLESAIDRPELKKRASRPCGEVLPPLAAAAWKRLKKAARTLKVSGPDEEFHEVRKLAKRARYTAELIGPALGKAAQKSSQRFARLATRIQDILGEHQDASVAVEELSGFLDGLTTGGEPAREARRLIRGQRRVADDARKAFFKAWPKLDSPKSLRWLKPRAHGGA